MVLTPGVHNSAFYEHALLARLMGVHLVEGRDLVCHGTDVFLRTTEGEVPVHVIYRRIDDDYLDPLQFRPESLVGCPGIVNAARAGRVTIANGVGNGVADDKLVYTYVPAMIRYYLGEDPILRNVETMHLRTSRCARTRWLAATSSSSSGSTARAARVWSSVRRPPGAELDELALEVEADPRHWIAQRVVALSTSPTWVDRTMVRRHVDLRPFAVNDGEDIWVLPGGLTRVALQRGRARRELEPGRRLQGHLGRGRRAHHARAPAPPERAAHGRPADGRRARCRTPRTGCSSSNNSSNNKRNRTASLDCPGAAEP